MKYRTLAAQIALSRKRTPRYRVPFPDLRCEPCTAPCSDIIAIPGHHTAARSKVDAPSLPDFVIATTHKQGAAVHHRREIEWLGGRKV